MSLLKFVSCDSEDERPADCSLKVNILENELLSDVAMLVAAGHFV